MQLTLDQAATRLGKTARQIRYLIQSERLSAKKVGGRWVIESKDFPLSEGRSVGWISAAPSDGYLVLFGMILRRIQVWECRMTLRLSNLRVWNIWSSTHVTTAYNLPRSQVRIWAFG